MKIQKTDNPKYPYTVLLDNGIKLKIPQQKKFGSYTSNHGCSVTAVSIATQWRKRIQKKDGTVLNPKEIYEYAKKHIGGYNGSKLSIYGCFLVLKKLCGKGSCKWYPNDGSNKDKNIKIIKDALNRGCCVLFEEKNPIHTVIFIGIDSKGKLLVATNGRIDKRSMKTEMNYALHGTKSSKKQTGWWTGKNHGAGFVVVEPKGV